MTATAVYATLLNRTTLSQKMGWVDEYGRVSCVYTIEALSKKIGRSDTTLKNAMKELVRADLLVKARKDFQGPNHLYLKCDFTKPEKDEPDPDGQKTDGKKSPSLDLPMLDFPIQEKSFCQAERKQYF